MAVTFSFQISVDLPDVTAILLNGMKDAVSVVLPAINANTCAAKVTATTYSGSPYTQPLTLSGPDAAKFALSHGGILPFDLMVGPTSIGRGVYNISLTAP